MIGVVSDYRGLTLEIVAQFVAKGAWIAGVGIRRTLSDVKARTSSR